MIVYNGWRRVYKVLDSYWIGLALSALRRRVRERAGVYAGALTDERLRRNKGLVVPPKMMRVL